MVVRKWIFQVVKALIALWLTNCERLLVVTPDLLRKSTPEGLVDKIVRAHK